MKAMKKHILLLLFCASTIMAFGQAKKNKFSFNPVNMLLGAVDLSYERTMNQQQSLIVDGAWLPSENRNVFRMDLSYRFHSGKAMDSHFWGTSLRGAGLNSQLLEDRSIPEIQRAYPFQHQAMAARPYVGRSWLFDSGFAMEWRTDAALPSSRFQWQAEPVMEAENLRDVVYNLLNALDLAFEVGYAY
jgi:hypothetical protein